MLVAMILVCVSCSRASVTVNADAPGDSIAATNVSEGGLLDAAAANVSEGDWLDAAIDASKSGERASAVILREVETFVSSSKAPARYVRLSVKATGHEAHEIVVDQVVYLTDDGRRRPLALAADAVKMGDDYQVATHRTLRVQPGPDVLLNIQFGEVLPLERDRYSFLVRARVDGVPREVPAVVTRVERLRR